MGYTRTGGGGSCVASWSMGGGNSGKATDDSVSSNFTINVQFRSGGRIERHTVKVTERGDGVRCGWGRPKAKKKKK